MNAILFGRHRGASSEQPGSKGIPMTEIVPNGYVSIHEALSRLGRARFPAEWTGEEHKARSGLVNAEEWLRTKDLPGTGSSGSWRGPGRLIVERPLNTPVTANVVSQEAARSDPCDPSYQAERRAAERYAAASQQLRVLLEAGHLKAVILDPWSGELHPVPVRMWRQDGADPIIRYGRAQKPPSGNIGDVLVEQFADASAPSKPMPRAKIAEAIEVLKEKIATESLTRPQQAKFVRNRFPSYHIPERQLSEIFRAIPVLTGRPRKSNKKV
jgi:hypothetical protein